MRRALSSRQTIFLKILLPILWLFAVSFVLLISFFGDSQSADPTKWIFLGFVIIQSAQVWECIRLKTIEVDDHNLYIANYTREISVPLSNILNVKHNRWPRRQLVTIHLKAPSEFGDKIEFIPKAR